MRRKLRQTFLWLLLAIMAPLFACGEADKIGTTGEITDDSQASGKSPIFPSGGIRMAPADPCAEDQTGCKPFADRRIFSKQELPKQLWCRYGYSGADEYCEVKVNEKAFRKN